MPRAYIEMTLSSKPGSRRAYFSTSCGSKRPWRFTRHLQVQRAVLGEHPLTVVSVAVVARYLLGLVPQMRLHLRIQRAFRYRLLQIVNQAPVAEHLRRVLARQQLIQQLIADPSSFPCLSCHALSSFRNIMLWPQTRNS